MGIAREAAIHMPRVAVGYFGVKEASSGGSVAHSAARRAHVVPAGGQRGEY